MGLSNSKSAIYRDAVERWWACGCFDPCGREDDPRADTIRRRFSDDCYYWCGTCWKDYAFHVANEHPLFSIILCHPLNPYTKVERLCLEWLRVTATTAWIVVFKHTLEIKHRMQVAKGRDNFLYELILLYVHVTIPLTIIHFILRFLCRESGRPDGFLERCLGNKCLCAVQWFLLFSWFSIISSTLAFIFSPGPWNNYGQDVMELEQLFRWTQLSVIQDYVMWFVFDAIAPRQLCKCPWAFGFKAKWRRERHEARSLHSACAEAWDKISNTFSSSSSGSSDSGASGDECCFRVRH